MQTKDRILLRHKGQLRTTQIVISLVIVLLLALSLVAVFANPAGVLAQGGPKTETKYMTITTFQLADGRSINQISIHGPSTPPAGYEAERAAVITPNPSAAAKTLTVPAYNWVFGCSAVSGSMIAAYWDRNGYPNMYTGPTNGGVMPMDNSVWPTWSDGVDTYPNNPLDASHNGVDGRVIKGSIDDYWVQYGSTANDPYITGSWTQHTWSDAIGDYMKTSQSAYDNSDGSTSFWGYGDATKLYCSDMPGFGINNDGSQGRKLFYEARGYTVTDCYNQNTDNIATGGFTYAQYKAEIDANRPVMINLAGHTIVGVGYADPNTVYLNDTWDWNSGTHSMTWGGSYSGMQMQSVSIVNLASSGPTPPVLVSPTGTITDRTPTFTWKKVAGATQYQFQVYQGSTLKYTKTVSSSACGATYCTYTPTNTLAYATHKWRARAYVGSWSSFSAFKSFTVSASSGGFNSQFNGSTTGWSAVKGAWTNYASAYYRSNGLASVGASAKHINNYTNFTYEVKMKRNGACTTCANRIIIRGNPTRLDSTYWWKPSYVFQFTNNGSISVYEMSSTGTATALKTWTSSSYIVNGGWNTLKVIANGSSLKYYINGHLVWSGSDSTLSSGQVGFGFYRDSYAGTLDVDWAKLTLIGADVIPLDEAVEQGVELPGGTIDMAP